MHQSSILLLLVLALTSNLCASSINDESKIIINYRVQDLKFSKSKDNHLTVKLEVKEKITSYTSLRTEVNRYVFFDEFSYVEGIKKDGKKYNAPKSDYEVNGIFHSDVKICDISHVFDTDGESTIIEYEKVFKDFKFTDKLYLDDIYPIDYATLRIHVPDWLDLKKLEWNMEGLNLIKEQETKKKITIYSYLLDDVEQRVKYRNQPSSARVSPHLLVIPQSIKDGSKVVQLMESADDLYSWYYKVTSDIGNDPKVLESIVADLTANATTEEEKVKNIFYWIQDNIRYLAFEAGMMGFRPEACQDVLKNKYTDCKGMANLTKEMLTIAGSDARLTWLGTSDLPYDYSIPSLVVDNHMICTVLMDGKEVYLDPTEKFSDLHSIAYRIQGKEVMIQDGDKYYIKEIPKAKLEDSREQLRLDLNIKDNQLVGNGSLQFTGERKVWLLNVLSSIKENNRVDALESYINNSNKNIAASISSEFNEFPRDEDINVDFQMSVDNKIIDLANELYINLENDFHLKKYNVDKRVKPLDLSYAYYVDSETKLDIPEGYKLTYTPEDVVVNHSKFDFNLSYKQQGNHIQYSKHLKIKDPIILKSDFQSWNKAIKKLDAFYDDQIILEKQ